MSVVPQDFLGCGSVLCNAHTEIEHRAGISRSYYAAYHAVKAWCDPLVPGSNVGPTGGTHQQFVNRLKNPAPENSDADRTKSKILGAQLDVVRLLRLKADYSCGETVLKAEALSALSIASQLVQRA